MGGDGNTADRLAQLLRDALQGTGGRRPLYEWLGGTLDLDPGCFNLAKVGDVKQTYNRLRDSAGFKGLDHPAIGLMGGFPGEQLDGVVSAVAKWMRSDEGPFLRAVLLSALPAVGGHFKFDAMVCVDSKIEELMRRVAPHARAEIVEAGRPVVEQVVKERGAHLATLPSYPMNGNVWVEFSHLSNKGDGEWAVGATVWSPSRNKGGADVYSSMREARPGDIVLHFLDRRLAGFSRARGPYEEREEEPPNAGTWAGQSPYYVVPLAGYVEFTQKLDLGEFLRHQEEAIRADMTPDRPKNYPFLDSRKGWLQASLNGYLYRCTAALYGLIRDGTLRDRDPGKGATPQFDPLDGLFMVPERFELLLRALRRKKNLVLQGPPGVGKTFIAKRLAFALIGAAAEDRVTMVQFHQSYSYEDFVRGWRPKESGGFQLHDGVFLRLCLAARRRPSDEFVLVIDEINRSNLSKVLGELMMLIETDKRSPDYAVPLAYLRNGEPPFFVPPNLYILGLMNTADRSLALVDYALRRRFSFVDLSPEFNDRFREFIKDKGVPLDLIDTIIRRISSLNDRIAGDTKSLGPGFCIGHSFFCPTGGELALDSDWYREIVETEVAPLLREYWFDNLERANEEVDSLLDIA